MYTIEDIQKLKPCKEYTREKLENLWEGKESLALREILELTIPIDDRNWVMPRLVPTEIVIKWAHLCAVAAEKHAATVANAADKSAADRVAYYANAADKSAADRVAYYANEADKSAGYAARSAADATGYAANADHAADATGYAAEAARSATDAAWSAASTAANAGHAAGYASWSENRDAELYRLLTILCDMEERCTL